MSTGARKLHWVRSLRDEMLPAGRAQRVGWLLGLSAVLGVIVGFAAVGFELLSAWTREALLEGLAGYYDGAGSGTTAEYSINKLWLALLPPLGGLAVGVLLLLAPEASGAGTGRVIEVFHHKRGAIRGRVPFVKMLASAVTLATGGSAGREGPIAHIGAGFGSLFARVLKLSVRRRRILMMAGVAAGIGAVFHAPLAGALFAAEVLYREMDMEVDVLVPSAIASIMSYSVFEMTLAAPAPFVVSGLTFHSALELLPYTVLALCVAAGAKLFVRVFAWVKGSFQRLAVPVWLKPGLGGVGVGLVGLVLPQAIGTGYGFMQRVVDGQVPWRMLLAVGLLKIVATAFTGGSGQPGGVFMPSLVIGGSLGGAVGVLAQYWFPSLSPPTAAFVIVGMAGYFAAAANTPLSTIIMVSELTGSYTLLVPTMWVSTIAFTLLRRSSVFPTQVKRRSDSPVHTGEMMSGVLETMRVKDACAVPGEVVTVLPATTMHTLVEKFIDSDQACFPVVGFDGKLHGVVEARALRHALGDEEELQHVIIAMDLMEETPLLTADEALGSAMRKMVAGNHLELVVVSSLTDARVVGLLNRRDLVAAYDQQVQASLRDLAPPSSVLLGSDDIPPSRTSRRGIF